MPRNSIYVGRPTKWGNSWKIGDDDPYEKEKVKTIQRCVDLYRRCMEYRSKDYFKELHGKNLVCWCPLDQPCHADVLLELANWEDLCDNKPIPEPDEDT
jgi:hypothetical protein